MLNNPLASSSFLKREVWKCFKSSSHTTCTLQVFARNHAKFLAKLNHFRSAVFLHKSACNSHKVDHRGKRSTLFCLQYENSCYRNLDS